MVAIPRPNADIARANADGPVRGALGRRVAVVLADTAFRLLVLRPLVLRLPVLRLLVFRAAGRALLPGVEVRDAVDRELVDRVVVDRDAGGLLSDPERDADAPARGRAGVLLFPTIVSP